MNISDTSARVVVPYSRLELNSEDLLPNEAAALHFLLPLSQDYPGIEQWYRTKVIPGVRNGTRVLVNIERQGDLVGLGIAKNEGGEHKICTVRVAPEHSGRGVGPRIFDTLLHWLDDDMPHLTVSEGRLPLFQRIFDYYGFGKTSTKAGLYVPGSIEVGFNDPDAVPIMPQSRALRAVPRVRRSIADSSS